MSIYFTRHGQTDWNIRYVIQGRIDVPLNEEGKKQAKQVAELLKDVHLDAIIASPMKRAIATAEAINEYHRLPIETDERIIEQFYGELEGKPRSGETYLEHRSSIAKRYPKGEGYFDVVYRVYDFLNQLKKERRDQDILIVAHGGMSRIVHSYFVDDMDNDTFVHYGLKNCELAKYEFVDREIPLIVSEFDPLP